jgi:Protein of unknown function (DUF3572)
MKISKPTPIPRREKENIVFSIEKAQALALSALVFLTGEPERIERFFALTGIDPADVRQLAGKEGFLLAVLDYMATDEQMLLEFVQKEREKPESIGLARRALGGGEAG